jgi:hypothetical protein
MCGLVGVLSFANQGLVQSDVKVFTQLWKASSLRGEDGAGVFWVADLDTAKGLANKDTGIYTSWLKIRGTPFDLQETEEYKKAEWEFSCSRFLIGHNRAATTGNISTDHAHPFSHDQITMVHNGTLNSIDGFKAFKKHDTDSIALCHALSEKSPEEVLRGLNGGTATIWYNSSTKTIHIYRNGGRPLYFHRQWNRWYIASEWNMLRWILARNDWTVGTQFTQKPHEIQPFKENVMYTFTHKDEEPTETEVKREFFPTNKEPPIIHLPVRYRGGNATILPPVVGKINKVRNHVPARRYFGLKVEDIVVFDAANIEYLNSKQNSAAITGIFHGIANRVVANLGQLEDVEIRAKVQRNSVEEIRKLYSHPFLKGKVVSITANAADVTDIIVYLVDIKPVSKEDMEQYIKNHQMLKNNMTTMLERQYDAKDPFATPEDGLIANAVRIAAEGQMLH